MDTILVDNKDSVCTITFNRPEKHNAFNDQFIAELDAALKTADQQAATRIVEIKAKGKSFCAGADLNWMQQMVDYSHQDNVDDAMALANLLQTLNNLSKPTIALVQGAAFGGGIGLAACCDIVLAADIANFCFAEVKIGLIPAVISPYVINAIGERAVRRYFLTAEPFSAAEAKHLGLVHDVLPANDLEQAGENIINTIQENSPAAVTATKNLIELSRTINVDETLLTETAHLIADMRISTEGQEGLLAFLEKRKPSWRKN